MSIIDVVVGAQWGDEGKGKLVDILCKDVDLCCRYNGGANAGHTVVVNNKKISFHLLPSGFLWEKVVNLIGAGVVLQLDRLMEDIAKVGDDLSLNRLFICRRANLLFECHVKIDELLEEGEDKIGTTKRGIGPCYATKALRWGLRAEQFIDWDTFEVDYKNLNLKVKTLFPSIKVDEEKELSRLKILHVKLKDQIIDGVELVNSFIVNQKKIIIEGANAVMLDINFGSYPYVTSSSTLGSAVGCNIGFDMRKVNNIIGVTKSYTTRVGGGPFPSEDIGEVGSMLCERGKERGTTTGRPRRCGYLDLVSLKYSVMINNYDFLMLTKLDILSNIPSLQLCIKYRNKFTKQDITDSACSYKILEGKLIEDVVEPVFQKMPIWREDITSITQFQDLPEAAQYYVKEIEKYLKIPIKYIGVGPNRNQYIIK